MFYGEYEHSLDNKGRLKIPSKIRDVFKECAIETLKLAKGLDGCLFLFPQEVWEVFTEKLRAQALGRPEARNFTRFLFSGAVDAKLDAQSRIAVPEHLRKHAGLAVGGGAKGGQVASSQEVASGDDLAIVVGVLDRVEIWAKSRWDDLQARVAPEYEELAKKLVESGLSL